MEALYQTQLEKELQGARWRALDKSLVRFFQTKCPEVSAMWLLLCGQVSQALAKGHLCLEREEAERYLQEHGLALPNWPEALGNAAMLVADGVLDERPVVFVKGALYFRRYFAYQGKIKDYLCQSLSQSQVLRSATSPEQLGALLDGLFASTAEPDWQRLACAISATSQFSIITGGPGTGKTTTVLKLLALLWQLQHAKGQPALRLVLAAPTGKAAVRLRSSIKKTLQGLQLPPELKAQLPSDVATVHKLLGARAQSKQYVFHAQNPLPLDVLVVDEASMLDVELFTALLDALPQSARLVLLGDKDQLASVEAGALLGSLCQFASEGRYSLETFSWLQGFSAAKLPNALLSLEPELLEQHIGMLRKSYRFSDTSGIAALANAVNAGQLQTLASLCANPWPDLQVLMEPSEQALEQLVLFGTSKNQPNPVCSYGFTPYLELVAKGPLNASGELSTDEAQETWAREVLVAYGRFQLLGAVRQGAFGVVGLNQQVERWLHQAHLIDAQQQWYPGRPVLINQNDYALGLMNGDVGICLRREWQGRQVLAVAFASSEATDAIRWVLPSRLPLHETAYAITVHKSQGSEFDHAVLVMPDQAAQVLTRELVYTAITRAAKQFTLVCQVPSLLRQAVQTKTSRAGSLRLEF